MQLIIDVYEERRPCNDNAVSNDASMVRPLDVAQQMFNWADHRIIQQVQGQLCKNSLPAQVQNVFADVACRIIKQCQQETSMDVIKHWMQILQKMPLDSACPVASYRLLDRSISSWLKQLSSNGMSGGGDEGGGGDGGSVVISASATEVKALQKDLKKFATSYMEYC